MKTYTQFLLLTSVLLLTSCSDRQRLGGNVQTESDKYTEKYKSDMDAEVATFTRLLQNCESESEIAATRARRGDFYAYGHRYEEALNDKAYAVCHGYPDIEFLALLNDYESQPKECLLNLSKAIQARIRGKCNYDDLRAIRAPISALSKDYSGSIADLTILIPEASTAKKLSYLTLKAHCELQTNKLKQAKESIEQALEIDRMYCPALLVKSKILSAEGKNDLALRFLDDIVAIRAHDADKNLALSSSEVLRARGQVFASLNKQDRAIADLEMADLIDEQKDANADNRLAKTTHENRITALAIVRYRIGFLERKLQELRLVQSILDKAPEERDSASGSDQ